MMLVYQVLHYIRKSAFDQSKVGTLLYYFTLLKCPFFESLLPDFKSYHNICSHSHLPPNLVVLPHLGQVDGGWRFSSSSNMSCQPSFWSSCCKQSVQLPSAFNEFNP